MEDKSAKNNVGIFRDQSKTLAKLEGPMIVKSSSKNGNVSFGYSIYFEVVNYYILWFKIWWLSDCFYGDPKN